jgi:hypothetical protein
MMSLWPLPTSLPHQPNGSDAYGIEDPEIYDNSQDDIAK